MHFFVMELLQQKGYDLGSENLLITSAFHMKRSKGCFDQVGLATVTFPVDYYSSDIRVNFKELIQPTPQALINWHILVKEWVGLIAYRLAGYI